MPSSISVEWINPFIEATEEIINAVGLVDAKRKKPSVRMDNKTGYDISAIVGLTGEAMGSIVLSFHKGTALRIVSSFLGQNIFGFNSDVADAVGEIANMIAGRVKKAFSDKGIRLKISIPNVVIGKEHIVSSQKNTPTIEIPFESSGGEFAILVSLKHGKEIER